MPWHGQGCNAVALWLPPMTVLAHTCHAANNGLLPAPVPPAAFSRNLDMQCGSPRRSASEKPSKTAASTRRRRSLGGSLPLLAAAAGGARWRRRWRSAITVRAAEVYSFSATSSLVMGQVQGQKQPQVKMPGFEMAERLRTFAQLCCSAQDPPAFRFPQCPVGSGCHMGRSNEGTATEQTLTSHRATAAGPAAATVLPALLAAALGACASLKSLRGGA